MKNIIFRLSIIIGFMMLNVYGTVWGQNCVNQNPSTNPANTSYPAGNPTVGQNEWDWTTVVTGKGSTGTPGYFKINNNPIPNTSPTTYTQLGYNYPGGYILSPFWTPAPGQATSVLANDGGSDFLNADGWELITRNFGYIYDESTAANSQSDNPAQPYFILYNKYSSVLRVFGIIPPNLVGQQVRVDLTMLAPSKPPTINTSYPIGSAYNNVALDTRTGPYWSSNSWGSNNLWSNYTYSGVLNNMGNTSQAMDMATNVYTVSQFASTGNAAGNFIFADFPVSYDPCTCNNQGGFLVEFSTYTTANITLEGYFLGTATDAAQTSVNFNPNNLNNNNAMLYAVQSAQNVQNIALSNDAQAKTSDEFKGYMADISEGFTIAAAAVPLLFARTPAPSTGSAKTVSTTSLSNAKIPTPTGATAGGGLTGVASIFTFAATTGGGNSSATAYILQGGIELSGTATTQIPSGASGFYFTNPGSTPITTVPTQEFYNTQYHIPDYPKYNEPLGVFALLTTPTVSHFNNVEVMNDLAGNNIITYKNTADEFLLTSPIQYQINPAVNPNLQATQVYGALEVVLEPNSDGSIQNGCSTQDLYRVMENESTFNCGTQSNLNLAYTTSAGQNVYLSPFHPLEELYNMVCVNSLYYNTAAVGSSQEFGTNPPQYKVYLKIIVNLVSNNLNSQGTPNGSILIYTYPVTLNANANSFIANKGPANSLNSVDGIVYIPTNFTISNDVWYGCAMSGLDINTQIANVYPSPNCQQDGCCPVSGIATSYTYDTVTVSGNLSTQQPSYSLEIYSLNGPIAVLPNTSNGNTNGTVAIGAGVSLIIGGNTVQPTAANSTALSGNYTSNLNSWCSGANLVNQGQTIPNSAYQASKLATTTVDPGPPSIASSINSSSPRLTSSSMVVNSQPAGMSLSVYPNPFSGSATVTYTLKQAGNVELSVYNILGEKVNELQNGLQSSGDYSLSFQSGNLTDGVYMVRIKSENSSDTQKVVLVK